MPETAEDLIKELDKMKAERSVFDSHWQEIAENMLPRRAEFQTKPTPGGKRTEKIFDGTAMDSLNRFSSGLHNNLTSKGLPWFYLEAADEQFSGFRHVKEWLEDTTRRMLNMFNDPFNDFHSRAHEMVTDLGAFGTGVMFIGDRPGAAPQFNTLFLGACYIATDDRGRVDTLFYEYELTPKQALQKFKGVRLPDSIGEAFASKPTQKKKFVHVVKPRQERILERLDAGNMPFMSVQILVETKEILVESGFESFPYVVPRWKQSPGEMYGRSPGMDALPDTKLLNRLEKVVLVGLEKIVDPPMQMPHDGFLGPLNLAPGAITYFRQGLAQHDRATPLFTGSRPDLGEQKEAQKREAIKRAFFLDVFELAGPIAEDGDILHMSPFEIASRKQDRMQVLGPHVSRLESEYLGPMLFRVLNIMLKNGMVHPPPREIAAVGLEIRYVNPLSIAQRAPEVGSISQTVATLAPIAQMDPTIMDNFNWDEAARITADRLRVPIKVMRTPEEVARLRQARAEQAQDQVDAEQGQMIADSAKNLSQAVNNA